MQKSRVYTCAICGEEKPDDDSWFLLAENQWEDKLKVLQWNEQLAKSLALACSPAHVEELVIHWMQPGASIIRSRERVLGQGGGHGSHGAQAVILI